MEYIDGEPLTAVLAREGALGPEGSRAIAYQVADALAMAHVLEKPTRPAPAGMSLPQPLVDLAMRRLDKTPAARPANARAVLAILAV